MIWFCFFLKKKLIFLFDVAWDPIFCANWAKNLYVSVSEVSANVLQTAGFQLALLMLIGNQQNKLGWITKI